MMPGRCLIVANQTLGGEALDQAVKECLSRDVGLFYVVVPVTRVKHETHGWAGGFDIAGVPDDVRQGFIEEQARQHEAELAEARGRAQQRLDMMIERIGSVGARAEGTVGSEDPLEAAEVVLEEQADFDEIIVSTLPGGISRWLKMDLPNRLARKTDVPVTTIEAEG
jgi:nucleotide-binding universal stress UspA family protein